MKKSAISNITLPLNTEQLNHLEYLTKNLSITQIAWISGYLWNVAEKYNKFSNTNSFDSTTFNNTITILYASQTGNAYRIAKDLYENLIKEGFVHVVLISMRDFKFKKIGDESFLLVITSTYGNGEPPEDGVVLYNFLFSKKAPNMNNTLFAVFGLGDKSYEHFAKTGKDFDHRLLELGASRLCDRVDADIDYQVLANSWISKIVNILVNRRKNIVNIVNDDNKKIIDLGCFTRDHPLSAILTLRQKITGRNSIKDIHHLEIDISGSGIKYHPGDTLGIWYENDDSLVQEFLDVLHLTGNKKIQIKQQSLMLRDILKKYYELTQNTLLITKKYAEISSNSKLLHLINDSLQLKDFIKSTPIIDMLRYYPSNLSDMELLSLLRPLTPRFYSIASAQSEVGEEIHIVVSVVRYVVDGRFRTGAASSYLVDRLKEDDILKIFVENNNNFRLPDDLNAPIIMISSGTGIAPFRAFMQQRSMDGALGKNWLFFGNPSFINDFLYQLEWQQYVKDGLLTKISTAWSRDQNYKIYIQDKLQMQGEEVWLWINNGAYVYVCGNADRMAYAVEQTLLKLIMKFGAMCTESAMNFLDKMRITKRYQRDVY